MAFVVPLSYILSLFYGQIPLIQLKSQPGFQVGSGYQERERGNEMSEYISISPSHQTVLL